MNKYLVIEIHIEDGKIVARSHERTLSPHSFKSVFADTKKVVECNGGQLLGFEITAAPRITSV